LQDIEAWMEEQWNVADEGNAWFENRKKRARSDDMVPIGASRRGSSASSSRDPAEGVLARVQNHSDKVIFTRVQVQACIDSLKRAKTAADSAGQLCSKASRAFYEEASNIQSCCDVLQSYIE